MSNTQLTSREYAYVHIHGPGTHEAISEALGLQPHEAWNVGDINRVVPDANTLNFKRS